MTLYYITFGSCRGFEKYNLQYSPAADQKGKYIIELLDKMQIQFNAISLSNTGNQNLKWMPTMKVPCGENGAFIVWGMFGKITKVIACLQNVLRLIQLNLFLKKLSCNDTVIVYHSLFIAKMIAKMKIKRQYKLILEVEEIYQDVVNCSKKYAEEEREVIKIADGYILATEALSKEIPSKKPYIVINGTYHAEPKRNVSFDDGKIHCVYAGTFDPTKGGAAAAAAAAEFLPKNYHVHILGFGSNEQTKNIKTQIDEIQKKAKCTLTFDGLKSGEEYIQFLQKCQIGLCTQIPDAKYTETSFPSKILVYLANGLRVLSVRIPAVENSSVGKSLYYYDKQKPSEIAKAIMKIPLNNNYDSRDILRKLDRECEKNIKQLLEKLSNEIN